MLALAVALCGCATAPDDAMEAPLAAAGDATRGREIFISRDGGHCVLCHAVPGVAVAGDLGPQLGRIGARYSAAELRLRVADISRVRPLAAMPTFHRVENLTRVAPSYKGKPVLSGQQVEDVVAYLVTLR